MNPFVATSPGKRPKKPIQIPDYVTIIEGLPVKYRCTLCCKSFVTKAHVKYHKYCASSTETKPFQCSQCGNSFIAKSHYEYHLRLHSGTRPYPCSQCEAKFNQRSKLTRHMKTHSGERPIMCDQCGRMFSTIQHFNNHWVVHTGEKLHECSTCEKKFSTRSGLIKHKHLHSGSRPFQCEVCTKTFVFKWCLDVHMRTHSTNKPFKCSQCVRQFSLEKDLKRHLVIHTGLRPFHCSQCEASFVRKDNLGRHIRRVHTVDPGEVYMLAETQKEESVPNNTISNAAAEETKSSPDERTLVNDNMVADQERIQDVEDPGTYIHTIDFPIFNPVVVETYSLATSDVQQPAVIQCDNSMYNNAASEWDSWVKR